MRKIVILIIFLSVYSIVSVQAQRSELGVFAGGSYYLGDLNFRTHFGITKPAVGVLYRYNINTRFALKLSGTYGTLIGDDASKVGQNKQRNLSFESPVTDISAHIEFNFWRYFTGSTKHRFTPYIFGGFSIFSFNPKAYYEGKWYKLQPLHTEGQGTTVYPDRKPYARTQAATSFGIGFKISISKTVCLGGEWGMRKTFTDYLDDVSTTYPNPDVLLKEYPDSTSVFLSNRSLSTPDEPDMIAGMQRGNSENNDWYSFAGITLTFKIGGRKKAVCRDYQRQYNYEQYLY